MEPTRVVINRVSTALEIVRRYRAVSGISSCNARRCAKMRSRSCRRRVSARNSTAWCRSRVHRRCRSAGPSFSSQTSVRRSSLTDQDTCSSPRGDRKRAVFAGVGGEFVKNQRKADGELCGEKLRLAVQGKSHMAVGPKFGEQQLPQVAAVAVGPCDQIVGRGQRADAPIDAGPDLRLIMQHLTHDGMDRRQLVFQPMLQLVDDQLSIGLFLDQALRNLAVMRRDRSIMLDAPYR